MRASPIICFGQQPCGFFPRRFLWAKVQTARRLQQEIGGEIVYFFHDSDHDPRETTNLYPAQQALGDRMGKQLEALERRITRDDAGASRTVEVDPDARDRLAALGYVGTFVAAAVTADRSQLADPKDKIGLFNLMTSAREASRRDKSSDKGLRALREVVRVQNGRVATPRSNRTGTARVNLASMTRHV